MAKELSEQHKRFLEALFDEAAGNAHMAKNIAGFSPGYSTRMLTNYLKEEIIEATQLHIAMNAPRAAMAIISGITDPTDLGTKEKLSAAKDLLDRAGLTKTDKIQVESVNGIMILPAKDKNTDD